MHTIKNIKGSRLEDRVPKTAKKGRKEKRKIQVNELEALWLKALEIWFETRFCQVT